MRRTVAIRDRTRLAELGRTGADTAHVLYYPGRIFEDARGIFVVVGRGGEEEKRPEVAASSHLAGDVLVEPLLTDEVSSPRRVFRLAALAEEKVSPELVQAAGGSFPAPDQILLGRFPFRVALAPVSVRLQHVATYRIDPVGSGVRQRTLLETDAREAHERLEFSTVALALFPNPEEPGGTGDGGGEAAAGPALTFEAARLVTAVLRAVLPALYRGAAESLLVALHVENPEELEPQRVLAASEGLYLLDAEAGGNGTARAIHRDGIDLLLRDSDRAEGYLEPEAAWVAPPSGRKRPGCTSRCSACARRTARSPAISPPSSIRSGSGIPAWWSACSPCRCPCSRIWPNRPGSPSSRPSRFPRR